DATLAALPARLGERSALPGGARIDEAIALLGELSRRNELTDFLTLPAYDRID
ncbi:MAG TPA: malate synthase A, partial [Stenotrophomonas sp.]|nr:malate synthase A [Stenotrophomonas sp.]